MHCAAAILPILGIASLASAASSQVAIPVATPTGSLCAGATATSTTSPTNLALAVAGCVNIQAAGTNLTRNDILDGVCKPVTLIFARGTTEDPNLGNIVGPPLITALNVAFGGSKNVAVQGVNNYPAVAADYCFGGSITGAEDLASLIQQVRGSCPQTKLIVSGYSQGCQIVHNGIALLQSDQAALDFIDSVILFGDPDRLVPLGGVATSKISIDCHTGDNICANGDMILQPHLTYCRDVGLEAAFALARSLIN